MKLFTEKGIVQKICIVLVIIILLEFVIPNISQASVGGVLFEPIKDLLLAIADGTMKISQEMILGMDISFVRITKDESFLNALLATAGAIVAGVAAVALIASSAAATAFTGRLSLANFRGCFTGVSDFLGCSGWVLRGINVCYS